MKKIIITITMLALTASFAQARPPMGGQGGQGGKPPQEAISACENQEEGTSCSVETPRGDTLEGTCKNTPDKKYFACVPNNHREKQ